MKKRGQVWVETVIYTLIALTIIGLFLSFARPKIEEIQDKSVIDQSITMLDNIDKIIFSIIQGGAGNKRVLDVGIKKGDLIIDAVNDQIIFELDSKYEYTESGADGAPGNFVEVGDLLARTTNKGNFYTIEIVSNYSGEYNITFQGEEREKIFSKSPVTQKISFNNKGGGEIEVS